jgi:hypothetical protein
MSLDKLVERVEDQRAGGVINPLVILRLAEMQHRKAGGAQPECIKLSAAFYHDFMKAYASMKEMVKRTDPATAEQIDLGRPHLLGLPIICDSGTENDITFFVSDARPTIIVP